jgi:hypothetical protein
MLSRGTTADLSKYDYHGKATEKDEGGRTEKEEKLTGACAAAEWWRACRQRSDLPSNVRKREETGGVEDEADG